MYTQIDNTFDLHQYGVSQCDIDMFHECSGLKSCDKPCCTSSRIVFPLPDIITYEISRSLDIPISDMYTYITDLFYGCNVACIAKRWINRLPSSSSFHLPEDESDDVGFWSYLVYCMICPSVVEEGKKVNVF